MSKPINPNDPECPDCGQQPLARYDMRDGDQIHWCNNCGCVIELAFTGTKLDKIEIRRPTVPRIVSLTPRTGDSS